MTPLQLGRETSCILQLSTGDYTLIPAVFAIQNNVNTSSNSTMNSNTILNGKLWLSCNSTAAIYIAASMHVKHSSELSNTQSTDDSIVSGASPWGQTCHILNKPVVTEVSIYTHGRMLHINSSI
jgi:hypothetical protein